MTTGHVPKMGRHQQLTRLPDPPKPPDAMQRAPHAAHTYLILEDYYRDRPDALVGGCGYLCYDANDLRNAPRPGCLVAFDVTIPPASIIETNGYTISEVANPRTSCSKLPPESTGRRDYTVKRDTYAAYRVREQWRFDHTVGRYHDAHWPVIDWSTANTSRSQS